MIFFLQRKVKAKIKMFRSVGVTDIPKRWLQIVRDHPCRNGNRMCHKKSSNASKKNWISMGNEKSSVLQSFIPELLFLVQSQTLFLFVSQLSFIFKWEFPTLVSLSMDENKKKTFPCDIFCLKSPPLINVPSSSFHLPSLLSVLKICPALSSASGHVILAFSTTLLNILFTCS